MPKLALPASSKFYLTKPNILLIEHFGEQRFDHFKIWTVRVNWVVDIRGLNEMTELGRPNCERTA